jgi:hypothetical protein
MPKKRVAEWRVNPQNCGDCKNKKCPEYKQCGQSHFEYKDNSYSFPKLGIPKKYRIYFPKYFTELYGCASYKGDEYDNC